MYREPGALELKTKEFGLTTEINRLKKEDARLDILLDYYMEEERVAMAMCEQRNSVLMHYNELQSRSAEVEAMAMNFEQRAAGAVAKAGLRGKPGPKKKQNNTKGTIGRGKANHSEWTS
jgi:hypothetical protein